MSILKKMIVKLPVRKSYLRMAWDATARGQHDMALLLFKMAYEQETDPDKRAEAAWNVYVNCRNRDKFHEAYLWCERTAKLGFVKAMRVLGKAYLYGLGIVPNYRQAVKWLKAGAELEDPVCIRLTGECYARGRGVLTNVKKAYEYFNRAYGLKEQGSYWWIGLAYCRGKAGYPKDMAKAMDVWKEGGSNSRCLCELGKCYFYGTGVSRDEALAYRYFKKVSDQGKDHADIYLSADKSSLRSAEEVERLTGFRDSVKPFDSEPEDGQDPVHIQS